MNNRVWTFVKATLRNARAQADRASWTAARMMVRGQSTVEYALVGALVVLAAAGAMTLLGGEVTNVFTRLTNSLSGGAAPPTR